MLSKTEWLKEYKTEIDNEIGVIIDEVTKEFKEQQKDLDETWDAELTRRTKAMISEKYENYCLFEYRFKRIGNEAGLENYFCKKVEDIGGWAVKFNPMGCAGVPDRIVFYKGQCHLAELKTPKGSVSPRQKIIHKKLNRLGFKVWIIRNKEHVREFIEAIL